MKTDLYTKSILTVIAVALSIIVLKDIAIIPQAHAGSTHTDIPVVNSNYGLVPVNEDGSINVRLVNTEQLDVNIKNIDTYDELRVDLRRINTSDELDINLDEIGGGWIRNGGPIPVKIEQ
ncbi:hypothetical protein GCM10011344_39280 [Dokdonia pacifica]|uniref:Uncharacterized protein n=1 Tax=Dokdonia pacifica TaxID=1627892 RepID=A0A239A424_9FLAO|nr:hypothetical protein [Dokdonia pacifica]GGG34646.1 hypothetical protein GCM10011344_39280 [Dokdonia pacifica]SNR89858.1 hypothetical protein SAMN06265376_104108 [Dokdonia pacifica]